MPMPSYPVSGKVYDLDGTTVLVGAKVTAHDSTTHDWIKSDAIVTTNALGEYTLDLNNFQKGYSNADKIQIVVYDTNHTKCGEARHTVNTVVGSLEQDLYMHSGEPVFDNTYVNGGVVTNDSASAIRVDFYDRYNDVIIFSVKCGANTSILVPSDPSKRGIFFQGGVCRICGTETGGAIRSFNVIHKIGGY